jgi:hypothetical protein
MWAPNFARFTLCIFISTVVANLPYPPAHAADWRSCAHDLSEVSRAANEAVEVAKQLALQKEETPNPGILESKLEALGDSLRSVQPSCGFQLQLETPAHADPDPEKADRSLYEKAQSLIQDPEFQQSSLETQYERLSQLLMSERRKFKDLDYFAQRQVVQKAIEIHTRIMRDKMRGVVQIDYRPSENIVDQLGLVRSKQNFREILLKTSEPAVEIDTIDIETDHFFYRIKDSNKEYKLFFSSMDRVEIFENNHVFIRGGGYNGVIMEVIFNRMKDAKVFADLIMSFRRYALSQR